MGLDLFPPPKYKQWDCYESAIYTSYFYKLDFIPGFGNFYELNGPNY